MNYEPQNKPSLLSLQTNQLNGTSLKIKQRGGKEKEKKR